MFDAIRHQELEDPSGREKGRTHSCMTRLESAGQKDPCGSVLPDLRIGSQLRSIPGVSSDQFEAWHPSDGLDEPLAALAMPW